MPVVVVSVPRAMKRLFTLLSIAFIFASVAPGGAALPFAVAQNAASSAPGLPAGYSVLAPDFDRADDEIIQLNNLTVRGFSSGSIPATIFASRDYNDGCIRYNSLESGGVAYPCPLSFAPSVLYQIEVNTETILLL